MNSFFYEDCSMSESYRRVYGIGLLDDIHNYFPALLYDIQQFHTVQDVLVYIRNRTSTHFNLFDRSLEEYRRTLSRPLERQGLNQIRRDYSPDIPIFVPSRNTTYMESPIPIRRSLDTVLLYSQPSQIRRSIRQPVFEDVIIHATSEILRQTSSLRTLDRDLEGSCSICQDTMKQGDSVRSLACSHEFHVSCIYPWLLHRSTLCPTCRHDIRADIRNVNTNTNSNSDTSLLVPLPRVVPEESQESNVSNGSNGSNGSQESQDISPVHRPPLANSQPSLLRNRIIESLTPEDALTLDLMDLLMSGHSSWNI